MNLRHSVTLGLPVLLLAAIAFFFFFSREPGVGFGTQGSATGETADLAADASRSDRGAAAQEVPEERRTAADTRQPLDEMDAAFVAALSGFRGRIIDHQRRPQPDRVVRFYRIDAEIIQNLGLFRGGDDEVDPQVEIHTGRTDAEGRFLVTGAWPSSLYILEADADGPDRLTVPVDKTPGTGEIVDLGDIQLIQLGVIVGRVVDEAGVGVPGAMIRAADVPSAFVDLAPVQRFDPEGAILIREGSVPVVIEMPGFVKRYFDMISKPRTMTAADGTFRLLGVQPRENVLAVNKKGYVPLMRKGIRVTAGKDKDIGALEVEIGEEALVRVVDSEDEPVAGAEILIGATTTIFAVDFASRVGRTDAKGELRATGWPAGKITVAARRSRTDPWVLVPPKNVAADIIVRLPGRYHFDLAVQSALGQKIDNPEFKLLPSPDEGMPLDVGAMGFIKWLDIKDKVKRLEDGRHRITDLIPGKYTLAVTAPGHATSKLDFKIEKSASGKIVLQPVSAFTVHVVDTLGAPVQRARIYIQMQQPDRGKKILEMPVVAGTTNRNGRLLVRDGEAGTVRISASHPAFGYAHGEAKLPTADPIVLRMDMPGQLAGILMENGREPTPGEWTIVIEPRFQTGRGAMPDMPKFTVPDLRGNFEASGLRPGRYRLRVVKSLTALTSPGGMVGFIMRSRLLRDDSSKDIVIESGQTTFAELEAVKPPDAVDGPSARVSGTVLVNGRSAAGVIVNGRGGRRLGVTADETGRFDLGQVPVGNLELYVRDPKQANVIDMRLESHLWHDRLQIQEGKDVLLDIQIRTGRIGGYVRTSNGAAADNVKVKAVGRVSNEGQSARSSTALTMTDNLGRFSFESLPSGAYRVEVQDPRLGYGSVDDLELLPSGVIAGVNVKLGKVFSVRGRLDLTAFGAEPPRWCYLQFSRAGSAGQQGASVRRNGEFRAQGLPPGEYSVKVFVPDENRRGPRELDVSPTVVIGDADITDLVLVPQLQTADPQGGDSPGSGGAGSDRKRRSEPASKGSTRKK